MSYLPLTGSAYVALETLCGLTGLDRNRCQSFVHPFDNLAGWTVESLNTANGQTGTKTPQPGTEWDGKAYIQAGGTVDSISRGYVTNIGGTWANNNPRTIMLDQYTPFGVAVEFQVQSDDGTYILFGVSDPTVTSNAPRGVYCGFEHGTNSTYFEGYKTTSGGGSNVDTASSTVLLDAEWHKGYVFADGSGSYKFSIDGETPIAIPNNNTFSNILGCVRICFAGTSHRVSWCSAVW